MLLIILYDKWYDTLYIKGVPQMGPSQLDKLIRRTLLENNLPPEGDASLELDSV